MPLTLNGTTGIAGVDGSAGTPAARGSDTNTGIVYGTDTVQIATGGTAAVTVDSSQNVGVGTATPQGKFAVSNSGAEGVEFLVGSGSGTLQTYNRSSSAYIAQNYISGSHIFTIGGVGEAARIDGSRNLLVGSASTPTGNVSHILSSGSGSNRGSVILQRQTASTSGVAGSIQAYNGSNLICSYDMYADGANNSGGIQVFTWNAGSASGGPYVSKGGTSWTTSSDISLKDITGEINNALDKVSKLRCVYYTLKDDETKKERVGFVAQEMNDVLPQVVDTDRNGKLGIAYPSVVPLLSAAIKELSAKLDAAEARIAALEAK